MKDNSHRVFYTIATILGLILLISVIFLMTHSRSSSSKVLVAQQQALASSPYADPILKYLPYGDIGYNITPVLKTINSKYVLTLDISILFDDSDYKSSPAELQAAVSQREESALSYIRSKGFDPSKYRIEYIVPAH